MTWKEILAPVLQSMKMQEMKKFLKEEREKKNIYPEGKDVFKAFDMCSFENTKVVIIGQDPYHTPGTAHGLAFSTLQEERPSSLEVIFKEIYRDLNIQYYHNITFEEYFPTNNLEKWTRIGFLLLNTALTVEEGKPGSHKGIGWELIIEKAMQALNKHKEQCIFLLWGNEAKSYERFIDPNSKHLVFKAAHPAAELYKDSKGGFYGCRHFSVIRDIIPQIEGKDLFPRLGLDACFDKEMAKEIVRKHYPLEAEKICRYIDKEMIINVPVNKETYWKEVRIFEDAISTKY